MAFDSCFYGFVFVCLCYLCFFTFLKIVFKMYLSSKERERNKGWRWMGGEDLVNCDQNILYEFSIKRKCYHETHYFLC